MGGLFSRATTAVTSRAVPVPHVERPSRAHVLEYARRLFVHGERVDMGTVADGLGIGRSTLYRWMGDRDQLLGEVLAELSEYTWAQVTERAGGSGVDRGLEIIRLFMEVTSSFEPLTRFAQREPAAALRVLMSPDGAVACNLRAGFRRALDENLSRELTPVDAEMVDIMVQLATALEWSPIVIGEQPAIDRAVQLMRGLVEKTVASSS